MKDKAIGVLESKLKELTDLVSIQSELLSIVVTQLADIKASVETALITEYEILARQGMDRDEIRRNQQRAFAAALVSATAILQPHLERIRQSSKGPPGVDPTKN